MSGCRIGRVKLKGGGATVVPFPHAPKDELQSKLVEHAAIISSNFYPDEMGGFVVIGWGRDGQWSSGFRLHDASPIGPTLLPSFVSDALRRDMIRGGYWE